MNDLINIILNSEDPRQTQWLLDSEATRFANMHDEDVDGLLKTVVESLDSKASEKAAGSIQLLIHKLAQAKSAQTWSDARLDSAKAIYLKAPAEADLRNQLLNWLASNHDEDALKLWAELVTSQPPEHRLGLVLAFAPLMQKDFMPTQWLTEKLLTEGTAHMQIAPLIFDVFNFWYRSGKAAIHPAEPRLEQLVALFGQLIGQLGKIEEGNIRKDVDLLTLNLQISDSVTLVVSLCDFFGLLKSELAKPKLHQAMSLKHRRVQTEASAALAQMGDEDGKQMLVGLASEPVARLRVLKYAEELDILKDVSLESRCESPAGRSPVN